MTHAPDFIHVTGAREHNLQNVSLAIPKNKLVVFTGLSGSGKSSLAFDTLYAEGQRRYVESLSSYARQFLGMMRKPDIDHIEGLSPAISIDQKTTSHNPRSTVGTITEIYDYLRLLFARVGHPHCPTCGREVSSQSLDQILARIQTEMAARYTQGPVRCMILAPVVKNRKGEFAALFQNLQQQGYTRVWIDSEVFLLDEDITLIKTNKHTIFVVIDRLTFTRQQAKSQSESKTFMQRLSQSVDQALKLSAGEVMVSFITDDSFAFPDKPKNTFDLLFSEQRACVECGISFAELEPRLFSFNSPEGACEVCNGLGTLLKVDQKKIVAPSLSLSEGAIIPFARVLSNDSWWARLIRAVAQESGIDFRKTSFEVMTDQQQQLLLHGSDKIYTVSGENRFGRATAIEEKFEGFLTNLERRYTETDSEYVRKEIGQYMHKQVCPTCAGQRLKKESLGVTIGQQHIANVTALPIDQCQIWVRKLTENVLSNQEQLIAQSIVREISLRLEFLHAVGLNYLTLNREAATLAGGEAQRIRLASQIGTGLTGVLYILDEPTIGLHQRDNQRLIATLKNLQEKGNSVIVVEHDRDVMNASDYIFDFGPGAGSEGGSIVASGTPSEIKANPNSLTGQYLQRKKDVVIKKTERTRTVVDPDLDTTAGAITITGAHKHNLQSVDVAFPLQTFCCITGVSGSGKSTLLHDILYTNLMKHLGRQSHEQTGEIERIMIPNDVHRVTLIDQSPIGKTPRSNPATYTKAFDSIRQLFANTKEAAIRGLQPGNFSFNVRGGRCESCQGDGQIKIEMQFLPDVYVTCEVCDGRRYNQDTLEINYKHKNISEVLDMSIADASKFFQTHSGIASKLATLCDVGLGYLKLGQPAPTLSGGEAQRVKLAKELSTRNPQHIVYLLDEPTTGLHFADIQKLLYVLEKLVAQGNTVIVIEHNLDVIKNADWIIDLGPEGGGGGGTVVATGTPKQVSENPASFTGQFLKQEFLDQQA
ncbi:MAG: excinuclease ABC subunit A [Candidatus Pacebacteria bacterium RIFCSPHIGHO2_01_FULL_46_16]|nr:MAG: excinuclease ABC subunit A [Candidatus Pacebacteria bacterium RIFCSPHIGHO2_01_FULL_46_16]OGJ21534.1 MAG: excinuclease ABC subunit A [Candidatus Pacebacteria bacterium RIFCSPHIGHO2_02_FULL_46_9]